MSVEKPYSDKSRLSSRLARYAGVGGTMAGLAGKIAGERLFGQKIDQKEHAAVLAEALGHFKGPLMKIGQILATIPGAIPAEYANAFLDLQSDAPPMSPSFVRRRMATELGPNWHNKFAEFPLEASNAASLGQVHKAILTSGDRVACKLQYPDMHSAIDADIKQFQTLLSLYELYDSSIKTDQIFEEVGERLREELDYKREARNARLYTEMLADCPAVHVPEIYMDLSTDRLLTMQWLDGRKILSFKDAPVEARNQIAINLFHAWYIPFYRYGLIHGDPHLGNYTICEDLSLNLLDFGCVRIFPPKFAGAVVNLYHALQNDDEDRLVHAFETWGFQGLSREMIDILSIWARFLYGPLLEDKKRLIGTAESGMYGKDIALDVHAKLRSLGGSVTVPKEFVFMDRAALGLGSVFIHLSAEVNWHQLFESLIDGFEEVKLVEKQKELLTG